MDGGLKSVQMATYDPWNEAMLDRAIFACFCFTPHIPPGRAFGIPSDLDIQDTWTTIAARIKIGVCSTELTNQICLGKDAVTL